MINYYQTYVRDKEDGLPRGIFIVGEDEDAILWDFDNQAWAYDPWSIAEFRFKPQNADRYDRISREEAEAVFRTISHPNDEFPDEETILWIFQWKGDPPQSEDWSDQNPR